MESWLYSYTLPPKVERGKGTCCTPSSLSPPRCPGAHQTLVSGPSPPCTATISHLCLLSTWPEECTFAPETFSSTPEHHIEWVMCVQSSGQTYKLRILTDPFAVKETWVQKDKYSAKSTELIDDRACHLRGKPMLSSCSLGTPHPLPSSQFLSLVPVAGAPPCALIAGGTCLSHSLFSGILPVYIPLSLLDCEGFQGGYSIAFISGFPAPVPTCRAHTACRLLNKWMHSWF